MPKINQIGATPIIALVILLAGVGIATYLVQNPAIFEPRASDDEPLPSASATSSPEEGISLAVSPGKFPYSYGVNTDQKAELLNITWSGLVDPGYNDWIGIFKPGSSDSEIVTWRYTGDVASGQGGTASGSMVMDFYEISYATSPQGQYVSSIPPGTYEARLFSKDHSTHKAVSNQFIINPASIPEIPPHPNTPPSASSTPMPSPTPTLTPSLSPSLHTTLGPFAPTATIVANKTSVVVGQEVIFTVTLMDKDKNLKEGVIYAGPTSLKGNGPVLGGFQPCSVETCTFQRKWTPNEPGEFVFMTSAWDQDGYQCSGNFYATDPNIYYVQPPAQLGRYIRCGEANTNAGGYVILTVLPCSIASQCGTSPAPIPNPQEKLNATCNALLNASNIPVIGVFVAGLYNNYCK